MVFKRKFSSERFMIRIDDAEREDLERALQAISLAVSKPDEHTTSYAMFDGKTKISVVTFQDNHSRVALDIQTKGFFTIFPKYARQLVKRFDGQRGSRSTGYNEQDELEMYLCADRGKYLERQERRRQ